MKNKLTGLSGKPLLQRFELQYIPVPWSGCWIWIGSVIPSGYGKIMKDGKQCSAHRISYELFVGKIPENLRVLHKCDVPSCVNPSHLFIGTAKDNSQDMVNKKRHKAVHLYGEKNGFSKLDNLAVKEIRTSKLSYSALAKKFNVVKSTICYIKNNRQWVNA